MNALLAALSSLLTLWNALGRAYMGCGFARLRLNFCQVKKYIMVLLKLRAGLYNPEKPEKVVEVEAIVDTGAIYSVVRRDILEQLGVKPVERRRFRAFGGYVERDVGEVGMVLMGRRRIVPVIFGEDGDPAVIGVTALEIFGLEVDVVRGTLKEAELLLL